MSTNNSVKPAVMALPVGHTTPMVSTVQLCIGKPFRQPINQPDSDQYSQGLEIWLLDSPGNIGLFAMLGGTLTIIKSGTNPYNAIKIAVDTVSLTRLNNIQPRLEPHIKTIYYDNIDIDLTKTAIVNLIKNAYNSAGSSAQTWHPILRIKRGSQTIKSLIDAGGSSSVDTIIGNIVQTSIDNALPLFVNAGDLIASAALPPSGTTQPSNCTFSSPRMFTIITEEYALNRLNPTYYIWMYLKSAFNSKTSLRFVSLITAVGNSGSTFSHPLLNSSALNIDMSVKVLPRVYYRFASNPTADVVLFPVGDLANWHGHSFTKKGVVSQSAIQWKLGNDDSLYYQTQVTPGGETSMSALNIVYAIGTCGNTVTPRVDVCLTPMSVANHNHPSDYDLIQTTWSNWMGPINEFCKEFQFPAEYLISAITQESGAGQRKLAIEILKDSNRANLAGKISDDIITAYDAIAPAYNVIVPDPIPLNSPVKPSKSTLTWDQLLQIINIDSSRTSPGLVQTLVGTARGSLNNLSSLYPDIPGFFNVDPIPTSDRDLFEWLLVGRQSLLAAVVYHKQNYVSHKSALDLPLVDACYNAGSLNPVKVIGKYPNPWLVRYSDVHYPLFTSRYYNATKDDEDTNSSNPQPIVLTSQFWKSL